MNKNYVPALQDAALALENAITKTANFAGTSFDTGSAAGPGGVGRPVGAIVQTTAADRTTGDETYSFTLMESADGVTWTATGPAVAVDVAGNAATLGLITVPGFQSQRYLAVALTVAGTTPSITYSAWLNPNIVPGI